MPVPGQRRRVSGAFFAVAAATAALVLMPIATANAKGLHLPAKRTSPTGNFFTLEKYIAPTAARRVAEFDMKVCTSAHTPAGTAIDPELFTLALGRVGSAAESVALAKSPALTLKPLKAKECDSGWLGFAVPQGRSVSALVYDYNGAISWKVG
jgi:hypothetical protein